MYLKILENISQNDTIFKGESVKRSVKNLTKTRACGAVCLQKGSKSLILVDRRGAAIFFR